MNDLQFKCFRDLAHDLTGVTISETRKTMLSSRVSRRMRATQKADFDSYLKLLLSDDQERERFVDKITTHETRFFRTPRVWEYLRKFCSGSRTGSASDQELVMWSAATSSGEEAYSLAMLLAQQSGIRYQIEASDVSSEVVEKASKAVYQGRNIDRFRESHPELFKTYMVQDSEGYRIDEKLKSNINFFTHNLFDPPPKKAAFDLVLLRNVLIYFTVEDQVKVLRRVAQAMKQGAILIIGESEKLPASLPDFVSIEPFIYAKADAAQKSYVNA